MFRFAARREQQGHKPGLPIGWIAALCLSLLLGAGGAALASGAGTVALRDLPPQARVVLRQIHLGGPFRYAKDGIVFGNYEHFLPSRRRGYYHEYTVPTPGSRDRGARRIVCGGPQRHPDLCYYTDDHYASFNAIDQ